MSPLGAAVRNGFVRGWIELRHSLADVTEWVFNILFIGSLSLVLFLQRNSTVDGTTVPLAALTLPGLAGMAVAFAGLLSTASALSYDREDGTLLRAKATPNGMTAYLVSRIVLTIAQVVVTLTLLLLVGHVVVDGPAVGLSGWLTLAWLAVLGLVAMQPWGAIVGARTRSSTSSSGLTFLVLGGLSGISGIFYPVAALPGWLQGVAQVFPMYWLGHGMRAALLPDAAAAAEPGGEWRLWEAAGVLGAWAVLGLLVAPAVLRRMARREAGSSVQAHKQRILTRGY
jgi:ABC-2 type transport system permease protein